MRVDHDDRVAVAPAGLLAELVPDDVAHQGRLAHPRAGHVEVVAAQQVVGEVDRFAVGPYGGRPDVGAAGQLAVAAAAALLGAGAGRRAASRPPDRADARARPPRARRARCGERNRPRPRGRGCRRGVPGLQPGCILPASKLRPEGWS